MKNRVMLVMLASIMLISGLTGCGGKNDVGGNSGARTIQLSLASCCVTEDDRNSGKSSGRDPGAAGKL